MKSRNPIANLIINILQWYIATILVIFGIAKISGGQFGIHADLKLKPITEIDKFYLMCYLFSLSRVFSIITGLIQLVGAILIIIPRTRLVGALVLLPVMITILLLDVCFSITTFGYNLIFEIGGITLADLIILYDGRKAIQNMLIILMTDTTNQRRYRWWLYLFLPPLGILINYILTWISNPIYRWCH